MARPQYPSDKQDQFMLRMPEGMRERIKQRAAENNRSMNAEIVSVLEEFYIDQTFAETLERRAVEVRSRVAGTDPEQRREEVIIANEAARKAFAEAAADLVNRIAEIDKKLDTLVYGEKPKAQKGGGDECS